MRDAKPVELDYERFWEVQTMAYLPALGAPDRGRHPGVMAEVIRMPDVLGSVWRRRLDVRVRRVAGKLALKSPTGTVAVPSGSTSPFAAALMEHPAQVLWHSGDSRDLDAAFWVTLPASWFAAHSTCVLGPVLDSGHDVVVDGWYHKSWSKLLGQGFRREDPGTVFAGAREPDHVVLLDADVATVFDRRADFRPTGPGLHAGLDRAGFVNHQGRGLG
ncbi:hypothetical protein FHX81_1355 [Saccharothrix saharensis]|uniref:Uncharacterized protein n=2 Tax=Saccharothrix saharensis TaxID=571190 RepID=A0A543J8A4_9PSEU|nr:hypothetical protein FHX81_1355 [Saccharothrix saharensis]